MTKFLKIKNNGYDTTIRCCGIRLKFRNPSKCNDYHIIDRTIQDNLTTLFLHQKTFSGFKEKHRGQDIVIFASGPSAAVYHPISGAVHIGINRSFSIAPVRLDYVFVQDYTGKTPEYIDELDAYEPQNCTKFYGLIRENVFDKAWSIPESHAIKAKALRYKTDWTPCYQPQFALDISVKPLGDFGSTTFSALQFALWTYPKRIYLVGCDCSNCGYAYAQNAKNNLAVDKVIEAYKQFKLFAAKHYPDVEIISVNPVGLKGLFHDEYQK